MLKNFQDQLLNNLVLRGIQNIGRVLPRKITDNLFKRKELLKKNHGLLIQLVQISRLLSLDFIDVNHGYERYL